jgi:YHS domain-containing protein
MKAAKWRGSLSIAAAAAAFAGALPVLAASPNPSVNPGLPTGLPELPRVGETMQRDAASGLALSGYDPVAYHAQGRATPGRADYELIHKGVVWRFASAANREAFRDAPAIYEPGFAGFDPTGVVEGGAVETDPRQFAIVGSRLFLFRTQLNRQRFVADASLLDRAETRWQDVFATLAR